MTKINHKGLTLIKLFKMRDFFKYIVFSIINRIVVFYESYRVYLLQKKVILKKGARLYNTTKILNYSKQPERIIIESNAHIRGELFVFKSEGKISVGEYSFVGENSKIWSKCNISIGKNVLISHNVNIIDTDSHNIQADKREQEFKSILINGFPSNDNIKANPIIIEDNVWISFNVIILKGVTIGKGSIIGAGSIITKNVEPNSIITSEHKIRVTSLCK